MLSKILPSAVLAAALAAPFALPAQAQQYADRIEVGVTAAEITSAEAATRYANVSDDLTAAIADALAVSNLDNGVRITVDLDEVVLTDSFSRAPGATASSLMAGTVSVERQEATGSQRKFNLAVTSDQVMPYMPENANVTVLEPSSDAVYDAVIKTFAAAVVANLDG